MLNITKPTILSLLMILSSIAASATFAQDSPAEAAVRRSSEKFVVEFNKQNAKKLARLYTADGSLKLPDTAAVSGRRNVRNAWQGGFDNGLETLTLEITDLDEVGFDKVVESGTYQLEINTPGGKVLQTGTYSVQWEYNWYFYYYFGFVKPKIDFDTIDAQATVPVN